MLTSGVDAGSCGCTEIDGTRSEETRCHANHEYGHTDHPCANNMPVTSAQFTLEQDSTADLLVGILIPNVTLANVTAELELLVYGWPCPGSDAAGGGADGWGCQRRPDGSSTTRAGEESLPSLPIATEASDSSSRIIALC